MLNFVARRVAIRPIDRHEISLYNNQIIMTVVKVIEVMSSSPKSWEDATAKAVAKAHASLKNI